MLPGEYTLKYIHGSEKYFDSSNDIVLPASDLTGLTSQLVIFTSVNQLFYTSMLGGISPQQNS